MPCPALPCRARPGCHPALSAEVVATAAPVDLAPPAAFRPAAAKIKPARTEFGTARAAPPPSLSPARPGSCPSRRRRFRCPPLRRSLPGRRWRAGRLPVPAVSAGLAALLQRSPRKHPEQGAGHPSALPGGRGLLQPGRGRWPRSAELLTPLKPLLRAGATTVASSSGRGTIGRGLRARESCVPGGHVVLGRCSVCGARPEGEVPCPPVPCPTGALCSVSARRSHSGVLLLVSHHKHFLSTCDFPLGGRSKTRLFIVERGSSVRAVAPAFSALGIVACAQSTGRWLRCCCQGNFWMHSGADMFRLAMLSVMSDPLVMLSALRVAVCEKKCI